MRLAVGDVVVYASHGIGRVTARRARAARLPQDEVVVLELPGGLSVILPIERAYETLRPLSDEDELARVQTALSDGFASTIEASWHKRFRATREKMAVGEAVGLAEIVRDGVLRDRRAAETGGTRMSVAERELYLKARRLLTHEISISRGIDADDADAWIVDQIAVLAPAK